MSQGKHISPIVKGIIAGVVAGYPDSTREELLPIIRGRLATFGKPQPADSTLLKLISHHRNQPPSDLDSPWSLASLKDQDMAPDCLPAVMQVWRFALSIDRPLTVRQACWASRLRYLFPNPIYLWVWACAAAIGERTAELVPESLDTSLLDTVASGCSGWELRSLALTGAAVGQYASHVRPLSDVGPDGKGPLELLISDARPRRASENEDEAGAFQDAFSALLEDLPTLDSIGLTYQAQMVYLRWFAFLVDGSQWPRFSPNEAINLVVDLRDWALTQQARILAAQDDPNHHDHPGIIAGESPDELLRLVGYRSVPQSTGYFVFTSTEHPFLDPD